MVIRADFHLRSCLSPGCGADRTPRALVQDLARRGIGLAALVDCNTAMNCPAFAYLCHEAGIMALYGMEAVTAEGVHVLVFFSDLKLAVDFCASWYEYLPDAAGGGQSWYVDEDGEGIGCLEKPLRGRADVALAELELQAHARDGVVIPACADAPDGSLLSQLGAIPALDWDAVELLHPEAAPRLLPRPYPVVPAAHSITGGGGDGYALDVGDGGLLYDTGSVNMRAFRACLLSRPVCPA